MKLGAKKCKFGKDRAKFVGFWVSADGVSLDPKKVENIVNRPTPKSIVEVQSLLGMCNYL